MCRTFSKIYGLANLRIGWGFGSKDIIQSANLFRPPFNISGISEKAGCLALEDHEWLEKNIEHNNKWSSILFDKIKSKKIKTNEPVANFFLLNFDNAKLNSEEAFKVFLGNNILLRKMDTYGIKNSLRLTVGNEEENTKFIEILEKNFLMKFITIIGVGLIGSSIARKIKTIDGKININIIDNSKENLEKSKLLKLGNIFSLDIDKKIEESDIIFICTPISAYEKIFNKLNNFDLPNAIISDVGSSKVKIIELAESILKE